MITNRQVDTLKAIQKLTKELSYPPTMAELAKDLGVSSLSSVFARLSSLERHGLITREEKKARTVKLTKEGLEYV